MKIAYGQALEIVLRKSLGEGHETILSLVESRDNRTQSEDSVKLTGWNKRSVLTILKELERVGVVRSEATDIHKVVHAHRGGMMT